MRLKKAEPADRAWLSELYTGAFPDDERAPFRLLRRRAEQGRAEFWCLMDGETRVGLAYVLRRQDLAYLFYLAVIPGLRGKGYGTQAIAALREHYNGCRLFLALETLDPAAENYAQRVHRHAFYQRCGLKDLPYRLKEASVIYALMGVGGSVQPGEYKAMINRFLGWPLRWLIDMRFIE